MRLEHYALNVPGTTPPVTGTSQNIRDLRLKYVQIGGGVFTGSLSLEVSLNDGVDFFLSGAARTAQGIWEVPEPATHIRVLVNSLSAGTPTVTLAGYNARTE